MECRGLVLEQQAQIRALSARLRAKRAEKVPSTVSFRLSDGPKGACMQEIQVHKSMVAIKLELARHGGITKDRVAPVGGGYAFRGIDDLYNVLCGLTAQHGMNMYPSVVGEPKVEYQVTTKNGRNGERVEALQTHVHLLLEVKLVSAVDGSSETIRTAGEAIDQGDKATNKAMSAAMKYACIMAFQIPVHGENVDIESHDVSVGRAPTSTAPVEASATAAVQEQKPVRHRRTKAEMEESRASEAASTIPSPSLPEPREEAMSRLPVVGQIVPKATTLPRGDLLPDTRKPYKENLDAEPLSPEELSKFAPETAEEPFWQTVLCARADKTTSFGELFEIAEEADMKPEPARQAVFDRIFDRSSRLIKLAPTLDALKEAKGLIKSLGSPRQLLEEYNTMYATFRSAAK